MDCSYHSTRQREDSYISILTFEEEVEVPGIVVSDSDQQTKVRLEDLPRCLRWAGTVSRPSSCARGGYRGYSVRLQMSV